MSADEAPLECGLDRQGLQTQLARYGELSRHVSTVRRWPGLLEVDFANGVDTALLDEAVAIERECCPFFELSVDAAAGRLAASVKDPCHDAALDALRFALTPS